MKSSFYLLLAFIFILNKSKSQNVYNDFKIYDTKKKQEITIAEISKAMADADVLYFGELHNDSIAHLLQIILLDSLINNYKNVALSLEALSDNYQIILNEYLDSFLSENDFEKKANVWMPYYHSYKPLIKICKQYGLPVIAANVPDCYVSLVRENGMSVLNNLNDSAKSFLPPLPYYIPKGVYYEKFANSMKFKVDMNDSLFEAHCLYDATIAFNIYKFWKTHQAFKIFQIIGNFHINDYLGTIEQLRRFGNMKFITISCLYDESFKSPDWNAYKSLADFVIVTNPNINRTF